MNSLLIHGCYDSKTLETLKNLGTKELAFDLRGRSANLVAFKDLLNLLKNISAEKVFLTFENDRKETIYSFLNLLKNEPFKFHLIFRDHLPLAFYQDITVPFFWMFHPEGDWQGMLNLPHIQGVLLPVKYQNYYQSLPQLWDMIDKKNLELYLHADNVEEALSLQLQQDIKLSMDLTSEVETSYRSVDQDKLKRMKIWRRLNENTTRQ